MDINNLADSINGEIIGKNDFFYSDGFTGRFTLLNDSVPGDIVIRHWINDKGVEIAASKDLACLITQTPKDGALKKAEDLNFPLIVVDKIELANAYALKWTVENFSPDSANVIITGTNGKSTTSHLIYHILDNAGFNVFTNTDSESEFNTLIDPMVSKMISDNTEKDYDFLVIEVSEVQGWLGNLMKNHAYLMSSAVNPKVGVVTNIAMDHIGLVNSIDEVFDELSQIPQAIGNGVTVLNYDDELVMKLADKSKNPFFVSMNELDNGDNKLYYDKGIYYKGKLVLDKNELPFTSNHFIQNILSAVASCISLGLNIDDIISGVKSYKALNRRFSKLNEKPLIIDDFAHNPDGIRSTVGETIKLVPKNGEFYVVCSIRGSRGVDINRFNVEALVESIDENTHLILSSSNDVVDNLNFVEEEEREVFFEVLDKNNISYIHFENLSDALEDTYNKASENDVILLIGAQGMDPAEGLLKEIL